MKYPIPSGATEVEINPVFNTPTPPDSNKPPTVNAGADVNITLPVNSVTLNGSALDSDGTITGYKWEKSSGGVATITSPTKSITTVTGLAEGNYFFQLSATDDDNATTIDTVAVTVKPAIVPPTTGYKETYRNGFDKASDLDPDDHGQAGNGKIENGQFHSLPKDVSSGIRSEVQFDEGKTKKEGAIEYDVTYIKFPRDNAHSFQFHPNTGGASACPGMWHRGGKLGLTFKLPDAVNVTPKFSLPVLNQKYKIRHEYKFSTGSDGYWRVYVDGQLWTEYKGKTALDGTGQYLKIGVNMWDQSATNSDAFYDNIVIFDKV